MDTESIEQPIEDRQGPRSKGGYLKPIVFALGLAALIVVASTTNVGELLTSARVWIDGLGPWAPLAFIALYALAAVAFLPGSALTVSAGAIFGSAWGILYSIVGATLGASLAFLIGRYMAREAVAGWVSRHERFNRLDQLTERHGAAIVAITRLVPIFPFNLLNYGFGLTRVRFWTYAFWSLVCMIPGTALYVVGADAVITGLAEGRVPWALIGALMAIGLALGLSARKARAWLAAREAECESQEREGCDSPAAQV